MSHQDAQLGAQFVSLEICCTLSDALTAMCAVCAAYGNHRGHSFDSAFCTLDPKSDLEEQIPLSRTQKRCPNRRLHALMLMCSCRSEIGATLRWKSAIEKFFNIDGPQRHGFVGASAVTLRS